MNEQEIIEARTWLDKRRAKRYQSIGIKPSFQLRICDY